MKSPTIDRLKAAVAQLNGAVEIINDNLPSAVQEAVVIRWDIKAAAEHVTDEGALAGLSYEEGIAHDDQLALELALEGWREIASKINTFFPSIANNIDHAASDALTYEDFKANEAKQNALQIEDFLRSRGLTMADVDELWKQRLASSFVVEDHGPIREAVKPPFPFGGVFTDRRVL